MQPQGESASLGSWLADASGICFIPGDLAPEDEGRKVASCLDEQLENRRHAIAPFVRMARSFVSTARIFSRALAHVSSSHSASREKFAPLPW